MGVSAGRVAFVVLGPAMMACSLVYGSNLDDARESTDVAGAADDGGSSATEASTGETSSDAGDAAGATRGCGAIVPAPKFCDDFEGSGAVNAKWSRTSEESGSIAISESEVWSGKRSMKASMSRTDNACKYTRLERDLVTDATGPITTRFRIRPTSPWTGGTPFMLAIDGPTFAASCGILVYFDSDGSAVRTVNVNVQTGEPQSNDVRAITGVPAPNAWTEVTMTVSPLDERRGARLRMGLRGENEALVETTHEFPQCNLPVNAGITINLGFHCDQGPAEARYDDVQVSW